MQQRARSLFPRLWWAAFVSSLGDMVLMQSLVFLVGRFVAEGMIGPGRDKMWNGALLAAEYAPFLLLAPVAGLVVDRVRAPVLLIGADLARMGLVLLLWNLGTAVGDLPWMPWVLAGMGVFTCLFSPAKMVLLWKLGEDAGPRRAAWLSSAGLLASAVGVWATSDLLLGGWLQNLCGGSWQSTFRVCLVLDALTFAASAWLLWPFLSITNDAAQRHGDASGSREGWRAMFEGFALVGRRPALKAAMLGCFGLWMTSGVVKAVMPEWAKEREHLLSSSMALQGRMVGLMGVGLLAGALAASRTVLWAAGSVGSSAALAGMALLMGVFLNVEGLLAQALCLFLLGSVAGWLLGRNDQDALSSCPPGQRGRVLAAKDAVFALALVGPNALLALTPSLEASSPDEVLGTVGWSLGVLSLLCLWMAVREWGGVWVLRGWFHLGFTRPLVALFVRLAFRVRLTGADFPSRGPVVLCANHASYFDPLLLQSACPRHVVFLMWDRIYQAYPRLFNLLGALPVNDDGDNARTVGASIKCLRKGLVVGVFPEGGLGDGQSLSPFHDGAVLMALRTGAPLVPVALVGAEKTWPKGGKPRFGMPLTFRVGEPIPTGGDTTPERVAALKARLRAAIEAMMKP